MAPKSSAAAARRLSREESKEQTREKLLAAGRRVFARQGLGTTQIRDVIGAAGVAIGTFYLHFRGKDELFAAVLEESSRELGRRLRRARVGGRADTPLQRRVEDSVRAFLDFVVAEKDLFRMLFREGLAGTNRYGSLGRQLMDRAIDELREDLETGVASGVVQRGELEPLASAIIGMCGTVGFRLLDQKKPDVEATTAFLSRMILGGIAAVTAVVKAK